LDPKRRRKDSGVASSPAGMFSTAYSLGGLLAPQGENGVCAPAVLAENVRQKTKQGAESPFPVYDSSCCRRLGVGTAINRADERCDGRGRYPQDIDTDAASVIADFIDVMPALPPKEQIL